ncbi:hypothetical protein [Nocardia sp. CA-119907]|uniref:hypothetical protein n=1 Tax=Nocardia sp. CA-119907 TaxID=3239973 RepID=UPI003D986DFD
MAAHKPAQIARHAAIVLAGTASLSLTVASGAYIVHQMAETQHTTGEIAAPPARNILDIGTDRGPELPDALLTGGSHDLPALFARFPAETSDGTAKTPEANADSPTAVPPGIGGKLRVGTAYVGAQVATGRADSVAFTVDTDALTTLADLLLSEPVRERFGIHADPGGVTQLRTEVDMHNGEVTLAFSDPTLGEHGLRLQRNPAPTAKHAPSVDDSTTPATDTPTTADATPNPATTTANRTIVV